jgi:hypothetical protein
VQEGRAEPMKLDKELMDAMFGGKVTFLQQVVRQVRDALEAGSEDLLGIHTHAHTHTHTHNTHIHTHTHTRTHARTHTHTHIHRC